jgi:hypothetical protein
MANSNQPVLTPHELAALDLVIAQAQLEESQANETDAAPPQVATGPRPTIGGLTAVTLGGLGAANIGLTVLVVVTLIAVNKTEASQIKLRQQITDAFAEFARENGIHEPSLDELIAIRQRLSP